MARTVGEIAAALMACSVLPGSGSMLTGDLARAKVSEQQDLHGPILSFKEIPTASELVSLLETFLGRADNDPRLFP
jgi:hypothetical protein